jgi:biotin transport system substrate-specific component
MDFSAKPNIHLLFNLSLIVLGSFLIAIGAKVGVPLQPVPVTLQSFAVVFIGMIYGWRLGVLTVLVYLIVVFAGAPVFAVGNLTMSTGYLIGFIFAVGLTGFLAQHGWARHLFSTLIAALLGTLIILLFGWGALSHYLGLATAFAVGIKPLLLGAVLKIILLALLIPAFWRFAEK